MEYVGFGFPFSIAIPYNTTLGKVMFWGPIIVLGGVGLWIYSNYSYQSLTKSGAYGNRNKEYLGINYS